MIGSQLQDYRGDDPTWGFVAQLGVEQFTGEVQLGHAARVHLYVDEGAIYFAERETDAPLQSRLVVSGVLSPAQLARGGVFVDGNATLARLFTRDTTIVRHDVETAVEQMTQELLAEVGPQPVGSVQLMPLRHHPSGLHEWAKRIQPPTVRTQPPPMAAPMSAPVRPIAPIAPLVIAPVVEPSPAPAPLSAPLSAPLAAPVATDVPAALPSPFSAPPTVATAASMPAPVFAAPAAPETVELTAEPAEPAEPEVVLPKLASRVMSMAEISAAHSAATGEVAPEEALDRYSPADLSAMHLPQLATKVVSMSELAAHDAHANAATADTGEHLAAIPAAEMPGLPVLHMGSDQPIAPTGGDTETAPTNATSSDAIDHAVNGTATASDPDIDPMDELMALDAAHRQPEPIAPWATPEQNLAAVEIWEMVDGLTASEQDDASLVTAGGPPEHTGGRWRRGKKG
jgi:hypothetical protein